MEPVDSEAFSARFTAAAGSPVTGSFAFGDSPELADELATLVVAGRKRATAGAVADLEADADPFPAPGQHWVVRDGAGAPRCVIRTEEVRVGPLRSVEAAFAWDEGELDRTRESWLDAHRR